MISSISNSEGRQQGISLRYWLCDIAYTPLLLYFVVFFMCFCFLFFLSVWQGYLSAFSSCLSPPPHFYTLLSSASKSLNSNILRQSAPTDNWPDLKVMGWGCSINHIPLKLPIEKEKEWGPLVVLLFSVPFPLAPFFLIISSEPMFEPTLSS